MKDLECNTTYSVNQRGKNGLRTVCLNWSFKFHSKRQVNGNNAS